MPSKISIDMSVVKEGLILTRPKEFQKELSKKFNESLVKSGQFILAELIKGTPVGATAQLRKNWQMDVKKEISDGGVENIKIEIFNKMAYIDVIEEGRRPGPISKEGMKSLQLWVRRKLGKSLVDSIPISYAIARKKSLFPTKGQFFVKKTLENVIPKVVQKIGIDFGVQLKATMEIKKNEESE